ncbi:MAG: putative transport system permease protein [Microbacteriaceae bacterium]|nr:putative transport system permease protein [Microbacteriaceae bacterium]
MLTVSLRNLLTNKLRLFLTVAAVTVGVAFVSGTFVLTDTVGKAFDQLYSGLTAGTAVTVRAHSAFTDPGASFQPKPLDQSLLATVSRVPGVAAVKGSVTGFALILDKNGHPIQPGGAPTLGAGSDGGLGSGFSIRSGRVPTGPGEVALDAGSAKKAGYQVGNSADIVLQGGRSRFTVVGIVGFGQTDSLAGATLAAFDMTTAQRLLGQVGHVGQIDVTAEPGVSTETLRADVAAVLPAGVEAVTGTQLAREGSAAVASGMAIFGQVLLIFAAVSVFVGSFVIWNTFSVLVAQRRREVGLLRAVGATRRQVISGLMVEAGVIGVISAGIGLGAGVGLAVGIRSLLKGIGIEVPTTSPAIETRTVIAALLVGVLVTMVAAVVPAWAAARVAPVEALRESAPASSDISTARRTTGWVLLGAGLLGLVACAVVGNQAVLTGGATLTAFAGLVTAGPSLARATARLADHGRRGGGWRMAARNIARSPRRSAATALALTIGLTVVCAVAVTASSLKVSVADSVADGNRSDLILEPAGVGSGISPVVADLLRKRDDIKTVVELRYARTQINGRSAGVVGMDAAGLSGVLDLGVAAGTLADFTPGTVLLSVKEAQTLGVAPGDTLRITFPETGAQTLRVAATFTKGIVIGSPYVLTLADFSANVTSRLDRAILLSTRGGAAGAVGSKQSVSSALADYPNVTVSDPAELTKRSQASVDQLLGLVNALLLLAVLVAILGIVNTLALSVVERTRELGLMRAVGATRRQVRAVVRRESVLMSLLGALSGIVLGTLSGAALSRALGDQGITKLAVPALTLTSYLAVAALVGVLAAIGPARRASRVDVLRAVTME